MADHPRDETAPAAATNDARDAAAQPSKRVQVRNQRILDRLEDDAVRETLRLLHAGRPASSGPASV